MAKPMTKSKIVAALAEKVDIPKKQSATYCSKALAKLAHKEAKNGFTIPGVGTLAVRNYKARMGRNPQTGQAITLPARKRLKFVVSGRRQGRDGRGRQRTRAILQHVPHWINERPKASDQSCVRRVTQWLTTRVGAD